MGHTIKGQTPYKYRPSVGRRPSGLSPINERSTAQKRWNKLRQSVKTTSQSVRNLRAQEANAQRRNTALLAFVKKLNKEWTHATNHHNAQKLRLFEQAKALNALRDPNYLNATRAALKVHKKALARLHAARNKVVNELVRNATSSQIRRNLYAMGMERGRHGTAQNNWQNWTNKLWHATERKNQVNKFFKTPSRA
jgi:septal ring factor EnvC (AmiA/AmiB activator)